MNARPLLACGIGAATLSILTDVVAMSRSKGYDGVRQSISELAAVGAPTRRLVVPAEIIDDLLLVGFGAGLWRLGRNGRALRGTGALITTNAASGLVAELFPMRTGQPASQNTAGVVLGAMGVFSLLAAMVASAVAIGGRFRALSIAILVTFAGLTPVGLALPRSEPRTGLQERTMAYAFAAWIAALAFVLWRQPGRGQGSHA